MDFFSTDCRDDHVRLIGVFLVHPAEPLESRCRCIVQIIKPKKQLATLPDSPNDVTRNRASSCHSIEGKSHAARADGCSFSWGARTKPLSCAGDPRAFVLVVLSYLPTSEQRVFNRVSVSALKIVIAGYRADYTVEGSPQRSIAGVDRDHGALFMHRLTKPFRDTTFACTGRPNQNDQAMQRTHTIHNVVADFTQLLTYLLSAVEGALTNAQQSRRSLRTRIQIGVAA